MLANLFTAAVRGIHGEIIHVEVDIAFGLPAFNIVGLADNAVREAKVRVNSALRNGGFHMPEHRITVNLAPADLQKTGTAFDLPIALGILAASNQMSPSVLQDWLIAAELSLTGDLRAVRGALPLALAAKKAGLKGMILPAQNASEAAAVQGIEVIGLTCFHEVVDFLNGAESFPATVIDIEALFSQPHPEHLDFADVKGQDSSKRAIEIAACGGHNIVMVGPPGSGKSMLAKRIPTILPDMTLHEALETTSIHSVAGLLKNGSSLVTTRPFRSPHHTISDVGLAGGGSIPRPGELSLSHHGVLFLDELPEFRRTTLEVLRQPLEDHQVTISRALTSVTFPAQVMLVGAFNPCPCGYLGHPHRNCTDSPQDIQRYRARLSGPLMDRVDIHIEVPAIGYQELAHAPRGESSDAIRSRVLACRERQRERFQKSPHVYCNARMTPALVREFCALDLAGHRLLEKAVDRLGMSARAHDRILKVARTIADMENLERIGAAHIAEAIHYRSLDRAAAAGRMAA